MKYTYGKADIILGLVLVLNLLFGLIGLTSGNSFGQIMGIVDLMAAGVMAYLLIDRG